MGEVLVGNLDSINAFLKEVLLGLVQDNLGEVRSVKANSSPEADDDTGEEELVKDSRVDSGESSAVGSSLGSVLLDPAGLDASGGEEEDGFLEAFLELSDEFFIDGGEEELAASEVDMDEDERLVLLEGVLSGLGDGQAGGLLLALSIEMVDGLNKGTSNALLEMGKSLHHAKLTADLPPRDFSNTSAAFLVSVILVINDWEYLIKIIFNRFSFIITF